MKIGVNCFLLQKQMGGLKQYFHRLFRKLLNSDESNSYVFFYFDHNVEELEKMGNERWKEDAILLEDQLDVRQHLDKIDLYFCPFGALWPRPLPLPTVVTLVDIQEKYYPQFFGKEELWQRAYHYDASTRTADRVITISEFSKNSIARFHHISKDKIDVAYLAADELFYEPFNGGDKPDLQLPERFIFYPANRWFHKNHDNLLKALVLLKERNVVVDCVFTGFDSDGGYPLQKKVGEYGLEKQSRVIGYVSAKDLKYIYKKAEMLCFPSLFEGFGMPPVEAMAVGCPVVCSNATCLPEVVGDAALLFNPEDPRDIADKIVVLWTNQELRRKLVDLGREQARKFSVRKTAAVHMETFEKAARSYSKGRFLYYKYVYEPLHGYRMHRKRAGTLSDASAE